jgi:hypothetical protein
MKKVSEIQKMTIDENLSREKILNNFNKDSEEFILATSFLSIVDEIKIMSSRLTSKRLSINSVARVLRSCILANEIIKKFEDFDEISSQFDRILDIIYINFVYQDQFEDNDTKEILIILINTICDNLNMFISLSFVTFLPNDITVFSKTLEGDIWQLEHQLFEMKNIETESIDEDKNLDEWF